jgi:hypothetical protein
MLQEAECVEDEGSVVRSYIQERSKAFYTRLYRVTKVVSIAPSTELDAEQSEEPEKAE